MFLAAVAMLTSPTAQIPSNFSIIRTLYREHKPGNTGLSLMDAGDETGDTLFIINQLDGANHSTPSGEGDPSKNYVTQHVVQMDNRFTGYQSCNNPTGKYTCVCKHEK